MPGQKTILCRDRGAECDWEVRDSDEREVLESAVAHTLRRHGLVVPADEFRPLLRQPIFFSSAA